MNEYEAGFATVDITPPLGTPMGGNFRSDYGARGVKMPLQAHAMVVRRGGVTLAIVSADLMAVTTSMTSAIRQRVEEQTGIPGGRVMVVATHTHSGPAILTIAGSPKVPDEVVADIEHRIAQSIRLAHENLAPVELKATTFEQAGLSFNRRICMKDGTTRMNWERLAPEEIDGPLGPIDPEGLVIAAWRGDRILGAFVNFGLHPAVLAGDNWSMAPDWPGWMREALAAHLGPGVPILYTNSAQGNINHLDVLDPRQGRGFKETQRIGYVLANNVLAALKALKPIAGPLRASTDSITVARRQVEAGALAAAQARLDALGTLTVAGQEDGMPEWFFDAELIEHGQRMDQAVYLEIQAMAIGDVGMVAVPGEFFVEFGLAVKRDSPFSPTAFVGLANGIVGYVPLPETLEQGGYEGMTWSYNQLEAGAGDAVVQCALRQLSALRRTG